MVDLKDLENKSLYVIRETYYEFKNPAALWSTGKDSTSLLHLCRKAFFGKIPFPVIHLDTGFKFKQMYRFRDEIARKWDLKLIVAKNEEAMREGVSPKDGKFECCTKLKTEALKKCLEKYGFDALLLAIRRDEHGIRAKERFFCFPKGTLIYGERITPIENIKPEDRVFTHLGSLRKVLNIFSRPYRGNLLSIELEYGFSLNLTPNHVVLAKVPGVGKKTICVQLTGFDGATYETTMRLRGRRRVAWVSASELKEGDLLYVPKLPKKAQDGIRTLQSVPIKNIIGNHNGLKKIGRQLYWKSAHKSARKIRESLPLTPDMLRVIGYYVAEGSSNFSGNQLSFAFNASETNLVDDLLKTMKETFGVEGYARKRGNAFDILFSSKTLMLLFSKMCGKKAREKRLPYFFTLLSKNQLIELIRGCWLGDGSNERYSTMSSLLAHQLRLGLLRLGILSSIRKDNCSRYHLAVAGVSKNKFEETFGVKCDVKYIERCTHAREIKELHSSELSGTDYGRSRSGGFWIPIKKIKKVPYEGYVYDLQIEEHSSYVANGLAVHNSPRDKDFKWNYKDQPLEMWDYYQTQDEEGTHMRVHPILHWRELDIWEFVRQEKLPVNPMYFARNGKRYRSLGCEPCTLPIASNAKTIDEIVEELKVTKIAERSGRAQDKERAFTMQKLRALGYM